MRKTISCCDWGRHGTGRDYGGHKYVHEPRQQHIRRHRPHPLSKRSVGSLFSIFFPASFFVFNLVFMTINGFTKPLLALYLHLSPWLASGMSLSWQCCSGWCWRGVQPCLCHLYREADGVLSGSFWGQSLTQKKCDVVTSPSTEGTFRGRETLIIMMCYLFHHLCSQSPQPPLLQELHEANASHH